MNDPASAPPAAPRKRALAHGRGVGRIATLPALLDDCELVRRGADADLVLAWGRKPSAVRATDFAQRRSLPLWTLEDGFLRSVGLGDAEPPLSIVVDDLGIYYDAGTASRLEALVASAHDAPRAQRLAAAWREGRVSKYNHAREDRDALAEGEVLVVDQTFGDASIRFGRADAGSFSRMLEAALDEHPRASIVLKVHPDVVAGRKRGHFDRLTPGQAARVRLLASSAHLPGLLQRALCVYTVTSQAGFEALLWQRPVRVFGMPFYAGWSLTTDEQPAPARRSPATLEALTHAALIAYPRYVDPETGRRCEPETLLAWMAWQRRQRERFPASVQAIGFSRWKKPIVRSFFGGSQVRFERRAARIETAGTVAVWGRRDSADLPAGIDLVRLEDGFLRSVGLGADLVRPLSWVMDRSGLYYDASRPSDLERLLAETAFTPALLARAHALRDRILALGVTKYNVGSARWTRPAGTKPVVLVTGQVESDAALALGSPSVRTNIDLLRSVRALRPDAHVIYKPHPDVVAQLRRAGRGEGEAHRHCDELIIDVPIDALLREVDEVHVMTSLAGFEALLRGKRVVTHGWPFYAGWGLSEDRLAPHPRRQRTLTLDELVAATLILYPTYVSRTTGHFSSAERALVELAEWRLNEGPSRASPMRRLWRALLRWSRVLSGGPM